MHDFLFDTHCHFDFSVFDDERSALWSQCRTRNIKRLLIPGVEPKQWQTAYDLTQQYQGVVMAAGLHPWYIDGIDGEAELLNQTTWLDRLQSHYCVAVGECGLDASIDVSMEKQLTIFEAHLKIAHEYSMPVIIHVRQTHNETLRLLKKYCLPAGGVIHGFTGSKELAMQYWRMGFYLGIGGSITYPRANKTRAMVKAMPLDSLLLETDAPDMPLSGHQGKPNSPLRLVEVAMALSRLRGDAFEHIVEKTNQNAYQLFTMPNLRD